jgi:hypothetical protein
VNNPGEVRSGIPFNCEIDDQVAARDVSLRFQGTELVNDISDDGSFVGVNESSLVATGSVKTFKIYAPKDGAFLGVSYGSVIGGEGLGGQTASGLWAVLNVNARGSAFYKSTLTNEDLELATTGMSASGHPIIQKHLDQRGPGACNHRHVCIRSPNYRLRKNLSPWRTMGE